jgi:hypothetical protein
LRYSVWVSDTPLQALEARRQGATRQAQRVLAEARADLAQRESLANEAHAARFRCNESLQSERALFGEANNVRLLRLREERIRGLVLELKGAEARLALAQAGCGEARERVLQAERALLEAESGRRAVVSVLAARRTAADKQRERVAEDEADDAFRSGKR